MAKRIITEEDVLNFVGMVALPGNVSGLAKVVNDIADKRIKLEGEALETLGLAFRGITSNTHQALELINQQLEERFERVGKRNAKQILELWAEIVTFDLSSEVQERLLQQLLIQWHEQVKQEKIIFGDIARISAVGVVGIAYIGAAAIGYKHARPKNIADIIDTFIKRI